MSAGSITGLVFWQENAAELAPRGRSGRYGIRTGRYHTRIAYLHGNLFARKMSAYAGLCALTYLDFDKPTVI